jgi:hypothetical protein
MVLKISKEPPMVSKAVFRLYTDYQLFMQKCFRKDVENFRKMRSRPHRQNKSNAEALLFYFAGACEARTFSSERSKTPEAPGGRP